jgi:N-methylhydantoinase B
MRGSPVERLDAETAGRFGVAGAASDSVALEIIWSQLIAIVDEMAAALARTAFSILVREGNDLSCVILDVQGRGLVQSTRSIPSFANVVPLALQHMLTVVPRNELVPGDVLVTNDPWVGAGHLPDLVMAKPIYRERELVGFIGTVAHLPDIGGGQLSGGAREVFEEGLLIPTVKLLRGGVSNEDVMTIIRTNVRVPDLVTGDISAQLAVCDLGDSRVLELMDDWQLRDLAGVTDAICARGERAVREAISAVPSGVYASELTSDALGELVHIVTKLEVDGDRIHVDYTGSSPQSARGINSVLNYTYAYTAYALKCVLCPELPNNDGLMRPFSVAAPAGSILNPNRPAAVGGRALTGHLLPDAVMTALEQVIPEKVNAPSGAPPWLTILSGRSDGRGFTESYALGIGTGARAGRDGLSCVTFPSNASSAPIEMLERACPIRFERKELRCDSGGAGRHRGGLGQKVSFEIVGSETIYVSCLAARLRTAPEGIGGGAPGTAGAFLVNGSLLDDPEAVHELSPGDVVTMIVPGGGGYGAPEDRARAAVDRDVRDGYVSAADPSTG